MESIVTAWLRAERNGVRSDSDFGVGHEMPFWMVMWYMFCDRYTTAAFPSFSVLAEFVQKVERSFIIGRTCVPREMTADWRSEVWREATAIGMNDDYDLLFLAFPLQIIKSRVHHSRFHQRREDNGFICLDRSFWRKYNSNHY